MSNSIALQRTVRDIVDEYDAKIADLPDAVRRFEQAMADMSVAGCVAGVYAGPAISGNPSVYPKDVAQKLLCSGWKAIYQRLDIARVASVKDKSRFEMALKDPAPLTFDNAVATFGDYLLRPRFHILKGLAEVFSDLDPAYKSHAKVRIGVKGLPKRLIIGGWGQYSYSWGRERLTAIVNALAAYRGDPLCDHLELWAVSEAHQRGDDGIMDGRPIKRRVDGKDVDWSPPDRGVWVRRFGNGNAHVFFDPTALLDINRALAEFYGEVLPDAEDDDAAPRASTAVAKDLQYYPTPAAVIDTILDEVGIYAPRESSRGSAPIHHVLEPSCGDGRILDAIRRRGHVGRGYEVDAGRAAQARARGHAVVTANFLEVPPVHSYDFVVMNPPFYGRHYVKHVRHAQRFLKPTGRLISVLPATAHYDHRELHGRWTDLPVASFAESGTNIPTGYLIMGGAA